MQSRQTGFPENLLNVLEIDVLTDNQEDVIDGIYYVLNNLLTPDQKKIIQKKYIEGKRIIDIARTMKVTKEMASTEIYKIVHIMKKPENIGYIQYGLKQYKEIRKRKEIALKRKASYDTIIIKNINIVEMQLPSKAYVALNRAGIHTLGDILGLMETKKKKWYRIPGIGTMYSDIIFQYFIEKEIVSGTKAEPKILLKKEKVKEKSIYATVQKMTEEEFAKWLANSRMDIIMKCTTKESAMEYIQETYFNRDLLKNKKKGAKNEKQNNSTTIG